MLKRLRRWREDRKLARLDLPDHVWEAAIADWPVAAHYRGEARRRLRENALRFLLRKPVVAGSGFPVTDAMRLKIATMAAALVHGLDLDWYDGWYRVILYESAFIPDHEWEDEYGIVHTERHALSGEAWLQGPVILSWEDVNAAGDDYNVVLHELAHKIDMQVDGANGFPPLHAGMDPQVWHDAFTAAWNDMKALVETGRETPIDPYALEDPGEFFAVATEAFFECPQRLADAWPDVYRQLALFYRQDFL